MLPNRERENMREFENMASISGQEFEGIQVAAMPVCNYTPSVKETAVELERLAMGRKPQVMETSDRTCDLKQPRNRVEC